MYQGDLSFVLLVFMLVFPVILLIMLIVSASLLKITAYCEQPFVERGKTAAVKITLHNRSPFPISNFIIGAQYKSMTPFEESSSAKYELSASLGAGTNETVSLNLTPMHCGTLEITVKNIKIYDLMDIFHIKRKISLNHKITVHPQILPIMTDIGDSITSCAESSTFSQTSAGDDPSEIFNLREYREGDRPNCIHWKLSSRNENLIVKELSRPVGSHILIITDFAGCAAADDVDSILDTAASLADFLSENGAVYSIASAYDDYSIHIAEITEPEILYAEINRLSENICHSEMKSRFAYISSVADSPFLSDSGFSKVIAVCAKASRAYADELSEACGNERLTIICTGAAPEADSNEPPTVEIIYADAEKLSADSREL